MKKIKRKVFVYVLASIILLQAGVVGYSMFKKQLFVSSAGTTETQDTEESENSPEASQTSQTSQPVDTAIITDDNDSTNTDISQEIQDFIKQSDPDNFDKNLNSYKDMLTKLSIHTSFKDEIERLVKDGHSIKDIMIAYSFLYDNYGKKAELEQLVKEKEAGKGWSDIFSEYNINNPEFVPRGFDSKYLAGLLKTEGISKDDIMIADRVSYKSGMAFEEVMHMRLKNSNWKVINTSVGILNSQQEIAYVPVTTQEVNEYINEGINEKRAVEAVVIANKLNTAATDIVSMLKDGLTNEQIYEKCLEARYY